LFYVRQKNSISYNSLFIKLGRDTRNDITSLLVKWCHIIWHLMMSHHYREEWIFQLILFYVNYINNILEHHIDILLIWKVQYYFEFRIVWKVYTCIVFWKTIFCFEWSFIMINFKFVLCSFNTDTHVSVLNASTNLEKKEKSIWKK